MPTPELGQIDDPATVALRIAAKYAVGKPGLELAKEICDALKTARVAEIERLLSDNAVVIRALGDEARLRGKAEADKDRLREALRRIVNEPMTGEVPLAIAREALKESGDE